MTPTKQHPQTLEVAALLSTLTKHGFTLAAVDDGDGRLRPYGTEDEIKAAILSVDESTLMVVRNGYRAGLLLVLGNEPGVLVCDYSIPKDIETRRALEVAVDEFAALYGQ